MGRSVTASLLLCLFSTATLASGLYDTLQRPYQEATPHVLSNTYTYFTPAGSDDQLWALKMLRLIVWTVLSVTVTGLVAVYFRYCWVNRKIIKAARALPTAASTLPIIGVIHQFAFAFSLEKTSRVILKLVRHPGHHATGVWLGPRPYFVLHRAEDIKTFLASSKTIEKSDDYESMKFAFGNGLIVAPGDIWKTTRRYHNPLFHSRNVNHLVTSLNTSARRLVAWLEPHMGSEPTDVHHVMALTTLQNMLSLLLGPEHGITIDEQNGMIKSIGAVLVSFGKRFFLPWLRCDLLFNLLFKDIVEDLDTNMMPFLARSTREYEQASGKMSTPDNGDPPKVNDVRAVTWPEMLVRLGKEMPQLVNRQYIKGEMFTLLGTGTDSLSVVMSSCLLALGNHPEIQDKVYTELIEVLGQHYDEVTSDNIKRLTYLDQVLKETMRFFVIVPFVLRKADMDMQIDDFVIPAGSSVILSFTSLAKDPKTFQIPEIFDPDHFSPENVASREKHSFLPFSSGVRGCIGKHYAMVQMKITMAHILKHYRVFTDVDIHKMEFKYALQIYCVDGYKIRLEKRHNH